MNETHIEAIYNNFMFNEKEIILTNSTRVHCQTRIFNQSPEEHDMRELIIRRISSYDDRIIYQMRRWGILKGYRIEGHAVINPVWVGFLYWKQWAGIYVEPTNETFWVSANSNDNAFEKFCSLMGYVKTKW